MKLVRAGFAVGAVFLFALACRLLPVAAEPPPSEKLVRQWIQDLDDDRFSVREEASRRLIKSGKVVIDAVTAAAERDSLEVTVRALAVLEELAAGAEGDTVTASKAALAKLASSKNAAAASRAQT